MNRLRRELAPISDQAWAEIDAEATRSLEHFLAARRLVDFTGPLGWDVCAIPTGRVRPEPAPLGIDVRAQRRQARELLEIRASFRVPFDELEAIDRGARDADLAPVVEAARRAADAEDAAIFHGGESDAVTGIVTASPHDAGSIGDDFDAYPGIVAGAVSRLRDAGIGGPYGLAIGSRAYRGVVETTEHGGYPLLNHLHLILGGPVVWAHPVEGAVVMSLRGGDFELVSGADLAIGYAGHDDQSVELYLEESFTLRISTPEAAIALAHS